MKKLALFLCVVLTASVVLAACGSKEKKDSSGSGKDSFTVGMVTDLGGVDDKSFNQSAWEGLTKFGEENGLKKGKTGYDYLQSKQDADYVTNLTQMATGGFDVTFGIGFLLADAIKEVSEQNPESNFAIVDSVVEGDNVASLTFAEHEGSYLVGVVAAMKTKTKKVGFVGGVDMPLIQKFQAGFEAGVKAVDPSIEVMVNYTGDFTDAAKGQAVASSMYKADCDVIYHAAGASGNGVFTEAKNIKESDPSKDIWVIGVDKDQTEEGLCKDGKTNITLTSMVKRVDVAVYTIAKEAKAGKFPGGKTMVFNLENEGVGIAPTQDNLTPEIIKAVDEYTQKIVAGDIKVPEKVSK